MFWKQKTVGEIRKTYFDWDAFWGVVGLIFMAILGLYGLANGWF